MKKMMSFVACLVLSITAMTAVAADLSQIEATSNSDMVAQLTSMDAEAWVDYLNTAIQNGTDALIKRVLTNAQTALNSMDDNTAREVAAAVNANVPQVVLARRVTGKYTLTYRPTAEVSSITPIIKNQIITKGTGTVSSRASKD